MRPCGNVTVRPATSCRSAACARASSHWHCVRQRGTRSIRPRQLAITRSPTTNRERFPAWSGGTQGRMQCLFPACGGHFTPSRLTPVPARAVHGDWPKRAWSGHAQRTETPLAGPPMATQSRQSEQGGALDTLADDDEVLRESVGSLRQRHAELRAELMANSAGAAAGKAAVKVRGGAREWPLRGRHHAPCPAPLHRP